MLVRLIRNNHKIKSNFHFIMIYWFCAWISLSLICASYSSNDSLQTKALFTSNRNSLKVVGEKTQSNEKYNGGKLKTNNANDRSIKKHNFLKERKMRLAKTNNNTITHTLNNQSNHNLTDGENMNKTSPTWFKLISEYFVLSENLTTYLSPEHGLDGINIGNQTLHHSIIKSNPIFIYSNFSNNQSIPFKFDRSYLFDLNNTIITENYPNIQLIYPPWNNLNKTEQEKFLQLAQGPSRRYSEGSSIGLSIYYIILLCFGIPGNFVTCCVILTNSYMRTAPNFFLLNIAIADLFTLILVIPLELTMIWKSYPWPLGDIGCDLATVISELASHVLIVTMISFSIERYFAICYPLKPSLQLNKTGTTGVIVMIWVLCLMPSFIWSRYSQVEYLYYSTIDDPTHDTTEVENASLDDKTHFIKLEESAMCMMSSKSVTSTMIVMTGVTSGFLYILPIIILPFIYLRISNALKQSENYNRPLPHTGDTFINRKAIIRMQMAVIICFLICWTPYHVQRIMFVIVTKKDLWNERILDIQDTLHTIAACCYFLSPVLNPFLYCLLSKRFRRGLQDLKEKINGWWANNVSSTQSSFSPESSNKANFIARPFMSLPNVPNPSDSQIREESRNALICNSEVPRRTVDNFLTDVQTTKTPQIAIEMISIPNNEKEKIDNEMNSFNGAVNSNLLICNDLEQIQTSNCKRGKFFSQGSNKNMDLELKPLFPVRRSSFNLETNIVINDNKSFANDKCTIYKVVCFMDLRTNEPNHQLNVDKLTYV